jgi:hypothetical protein
MAKQTSTHGGTNMPISSSNPIDFAAIAVEMRGAVARWYNAEVEIIDPNTRDLDDEWNPVTNTYTSPTDTVLWSGSARVQPLRTASMPDLGVTQGAIEAIRVQVPYDASLGFVQKGMRVRVTNGGEDAVLEDLEFIVRSAVNSSYGWNRTIECDTDVKSVANG